MSHPAVRAIDVSKRYQLGMRRAKYATLRETLMRGFRPRDAVVEVEREHWALRQVSFEVLPGEVVGVIGHNGAGKSTLLKVLSRITEPTSGRVEISGRVASLLEVGTGFHPELTGRENVFLNGAILGMRRVEITRKFDEIVSFAEVQKFIDTPVKHYSSGMYLRLAFAVAAHLESEVLLVDEVLAVGDQAFQRRCLNKMGDVARSGRTVLLVSHNLAAVESLCERAFLIANGMLVLASDVREVVRRYSLISGERVRESLRDRQDRRGDGAFRFVGVRIYPVDDPDSGLYSGCDAVVELDYESAGSSKSTRIAISVLDQHDRMLFACDSEHVGGPLELDEAGTVACTIGSLPLAPGTYRLMLWATVAGNVSDHVQHAAEFVVSPADFFGTGRLPDNPKYGPFLVRHRWLQARRTPS